MDQKVHPRGLRVGVIEDWDTKWYTSKKSFADNLVEDNRIREFIGKELFSADILEIGIEGVARRVKLNIYTAKPDVVIGKGGAGIEALKARLAKITDNRNLLVGIVKVKNAEANVQLMAEDIATQLKKRVSFRRVMKQSIQKAMRLRAKNAKTACSDKLGGVETARTEQYHEGTIPLQALKADIDYEFARADTAYRKVGIEVWVYNGEVLPAKKVEKEEEVSA